MYLWPALAVCLQGPTHQKGGATVSNITRAKCIAHRCLRQVHCASPLCQVHCGFCLRTPGLVGCPGSGPDPWLPPGSTSFEGRREGAELVFVTKNLAKPSIWSCNFESSRSMSSRMQSGPGMESGASRFKLMPYRNGTPRTPRASKGAEGARGASLCDQKSCQALEQFSRELFGQSCNFES